MERMEPSKPSAIQTTTEERSSKMSINVYLKDEAEKRSILGVNICNKKGRWYITLNELSEPIPEKIADIVEEISLIEYLPAEPKRESGLYYHETAKAEVTPSSASGKPITKVHITATKIGDIRTLFRLIRTGKVRPDESYEQEQGGMSYKELREALSTAQRELQDTAFELRTLVDQHEGATSALRELQVTSDKAHTRLTRLRGLAQNLKSETWWFTCKITAANQIENILLEE